MANAVFFKKVIVNHSGACEGFSYVAGQPVDLPESVLKAVGSNNFEVVVQPKAPEKKAVKKDEKPQKAEEKEQVKKEEIKPEQPKVPEAELSENTTPATKAENKK